MEDYLGGLLDDFPEEITQSLETLSASDLFTIREENEQDILDKTWSNLSIMRWQN